MFEHLRDAVLISLFDVRDGYWICPISKESMPLTAFQSECGEWMWKCLPQGMSCSGPYYQAWLGRLSRRSPPVLGRYTLRERTHLNT